MLLFLYSAGQKNIQQGTDLVFYLHCCAIQILL